MSKASPVLMGIVICWLTNDCSLAMAEMTTLVAAIYQRYSTSVKMGCEDVTPGITSRFEVFHDDRFKKVSVSIVVPVIVGQYLANHHSGA